MKTFRYEGLDASGARKTGWTEAEEEKGAVRALAARGIYVERLVPAPSASPESLGESERAAMYRELGALLKAGIPLERALTLLLDESGGGGRRASVFLAMRSGIREGKRFSEVLGAASGFESSMLATAERTGAFGEVLTTLAESLEKKIRTAESFRSAASYPLFVLFLGVLVGVLMLGVLVPLAQKKLQEVGMSLPGESVLIVHCARCAAWGALGLVLVAAVCWAVVRWMCARDRDTAAAWGRRILHIVPFGRPLRALAASRFAATLATLCRSDVPLVDGFPLAGSATGNAWIEKRSLEETETIRGSGATVEAAVGAIPELSPALREWVRVGEAGGCLPEMLSLAATRAETVWERAYTRAMNLMGPVFLVLVGAFVLIVALSVLLPMVDLTLDMGNLGR